MALVRAVLKYRNHILHDWLFSFKACSSDTNKTNILYKNVISYDHQRLWRYFAVFFCDTRFAAMINLRLTTYCLISCCFLKMACPRFWNDLMTVLQ